MPSGGSRPGAGRPKGARDKFNVALHERFAVGADDPVQVLIDLMRGKDRSIRLRAAQALMPYVYPKLSAAAIDVSPGRETSVLFVMPDGSEADF